MSDYEQHKGKARIVPRAANQTLEELCKEICEKEGFTGSYSSYKEILEDNSYKRFVIIGDELYEVYERGGLDDYDDIFHAEKNSDNSISFILRYYNGGCSFDEAFTTAIEGMEEQEKEAA